MLGESDNRQHERQYVRAMPTGRYRPNNNYDLASRHGYRC
jgi:hypothetical protein